MDHIWDLESDTLKQYKLQLLSAVHILKDLPKDLPKDDVEALMEKTPMRTTPKGTAIYGSEGSEELFLLKSGQVELYRDNRRTDSGSLWRLSKNAHFWGNVAG